MPSGTWTADDLTTARQRGRQLLAWGGAVLAAVAIAALLFLATSPPRAPLELREPGVHAHLAAVDLLPGYDVDEPRRRLGPARLTLDDGRTVFLPARTPYSGARPCRALRPPEDREAGVCTVLLWLDEEDTSVVWLTSLRPGGPGEALLDGRLLTGSNDQLVLDDGTTVPVAASLRLAECGDRDLDDVIGRRVVLSIDDASGAVRQLTCRA